MRLVPFAVLAALPLLAAAAEPAPADAERVCRSGSPEPDACAALGRADVEKGAARRAAAAFLFACEGGAPDGCAGLAALHATGRGVPRDDARAVALARSGCDRGSPASCANLATLLALGRGTPASADEPATLRSRACAAGVVQACTALGQAAPEGASPHPLVLDQVGAPPAAWRPAKAVVRNEKLDAMFADVFAAARGIELLVVPRELWAALGITDAKAFLYQPTSAGDVDVSGIALRAHARALRGCAEAGGKGRAMIAWVTFQTTPQEAPADVRVAGDDLAPEVAACLASAAARWDVRGLVRPGERYLVTAPAVMGELLPPPAEPMAAEESERVAITGPTMPEGFTPSSMSERGCVGKQLGELAAMMEWPANRVEFKFAVTAQGAVRRFHPLSAVTAPVANAVRRAVTVCTWTPAKDAGGAPVTSWVILPIRFAH